MRFTALRNSRLCLLKMLCLCLLFSSITIFLTMIWTGGWIESRTFSRLKHGISANSVTGMNLLIETGKESVMGENKAHQKAAKKSFHSIFGSSPFENKSEHKPSNASTPQCTSLVDPSFQLLCKRFPTMMIIGFGKAGTRALYEVLLLRPDLAGPSKEPRFFSRKYMKGLSTYLSSLPEPPLTGGWVIEKSPDYILDGLVLKRIDHILQLFHIQARDLKFVVMLRDPIDRAMSEYLEWNILRQQTKKRSLPSFQKMVLQDGNVDETVPFIKASYYTTYVSRWLKHFNQSQICFVDGDQFIIDPYLEVHMLEKCLGLPTYFTPSNFVYNLKKGFYCFQSEGGELCMNGSKGRKHPSIPPLVMKKLQEHYRPMAKELFKVIGRTLNWPNFYGVNL